MSKYLMALDQGTTSSRCIIFDRYGNIVSMAQKEFPNYFPAEGWVEHDPNEIWETQLSVTKQAMQKSNISASDVAAIGITNQRETTVVWNKKTGEPIYRAIVWQCRRTAEYCDNLKAQGLTDMIRKKQDSLLIHIFLLQKSNGSLTMSQVQKKLRIQVN